jgi:hypothetical protein
MQRKTCREEMRAIAMNELRSNVMCVYVYSKWELYLAIGFKSA